MRRRPELRRGGVPRGGRAAGRGVAAALVLLAFAASPPAPRVETPELRALFDGRRFFELRELLGEADEAASSPEERFYRAALELAFNRPESAWRALRELPEGLPLELDLRATRLSLSVALRRHRYADALLAADALAAKPAARIQPERRAEAENLGRLARALRDVPPQTIELEGPSRLALHSDGRVPIRIGEHRTRLAVDTGANLSVLGRSEALAAGLTAADGTSRRLPA